MMTVRLGDTNGGIELRSYATDVIRGMGLSILRESEQSASTDEHNRFSSKLKELIMGELQDAALGITHYMRVGPSNVRAGMARGLAEIEDELTNYLKMVQSEASTDGLPWWMSLDIAEEAKECFHYCLHCEAGSSNKVFTNSSYPRDHDENGVRADRCTALNAGKRLVDFCDLEEVQTAKLEVAHVAALRIYTTAAFKVLNGPLRTPWPKHPHPFPVTMSFLTEAVGKLRAVNATTLLAGKKLDLWRGVADVAVSESFMDQGGTEVSPMSTSHDLKTAVEYSGAANSLILKLRTDTFMARGASIQFLSAFPKENEVLYPPLTFLKPTGKQESISCDGRMFTIIEVVPHYGGA